ncbi:hypothetical protein HMY34_14620 [Thiothrix subterranea]|uniref:hypothetical protein n=1 Tax=Thiothrix subterranea TaxID=2735563 RepID=UPI00192C700F|nr:hypothetical protein [Thiothrix subterranea]QQZ29894.1 hypothetical protein HMY34_14620 [Thiothrix subterranea]
MKNVLGAALMAASLMVSVDAMAARGGGSGSPAVAQLAATLTPPPAPGQPVVVPDVGAGTRVTTFQTVIASNTSFSGR